MREGDIVIKCPIYGYIKINELGRKIIDTLPLQRLRRIKQLAGSEYVYPGANHARFEHSIGVMHLAEKLVNSLPVELEEEEKTSVILAGLVHDVGHGPLSHVFESLLTYYLDKTHEDLTLWIVENSETNDILEEGGYDPKTVGKLAIGRLNKPGKRFLDQMFVSAFDVDKMDFIVRDSFHTGAEYGHVDISRLILSMDVLGEDLAVDVGALSALEAFLIARLESFRAIYFHRAVRAVQIMLEKALKAAHEELGLLSFKSPEEYLAMDDYSVWTDLKRCEKSSEMIQAIEKRDLLKCAYEKVFFTRDKFLTSIFTKEKLRKQIEEEIAAEAKIDPQLVTLDVPYLPSVPYHRAVEVEPTKIPIFEERGGVKFLRRLEDLSRIIDSLQVFMNIARVYTKKEHREKVSSSAERVLEKLPFEVTF